MFKRGSIIWTIWNVIEAALLVVSGVLCMAWANQSHFQQIAVLVAGVMVIVDAGLRLLLGTIEIVAAEDTTMIKTNANQGIAGAAELSLGIALCYIYANYEGSADIAAAKNVFGYIGIYMGVLLIVFAAMILVHALILTLRKITSIPGGLGMLIIGGIVLALGIIAVINLNPSKCENVVTFFLVVFGISTVIIGVALGFTAIIALIAKKRLNDAAKRDPSVNQSEDPDPSEKPIEEEPKPEE